MLKKTECCYYFMMTRKLFLFLAVLFISANAAAVGNIEITETTVPNTVEKGDSFTVEVTVENRGTTDEMVRVISEALGQRSVSEELNIAPGEEEDFTGDFTVPVSERTGPFTVSFKADSTDDYDFSEIESTVSSIDGYMTLTPEKGRIGSPVMIKGRLRHTDTGNGADHVSANLYEGNRFITEIKTDRMGYFKTYFTPDRTGSFSVRLVNEGIVVDRKMIVEPVIEIGELETTERIKERGEAKVCIEPIFRGTNSVEASLETEEGDEKTTERKDVLENRQRTCFSLETEKTGLKEGKIVLESGRYSASKTFNYMVEERVQTPEIEIRKTEAKVRNGRLRITAHINQNTTEEKNITVQLLSDKIIEKKNSGLDSEGKEFVFVLEEIPETPVKLEVKMGENSWIKEIELPDESLETVMSSPSGFIGYSMTGLKILGIGVVVLFIIAFVFGIFNPDALEPER